MNLPFACLAEVECKIICASQFRRARIMPKLLTWPSGLAPFPWESRTSRTARIPGPFPLPLPVPVRLPLYMSIGFSLMRRPVVGQKQIVKKTAQEEYQLVPNPTFIPAAFKHSRVFGGDEQRGALKFSGLHKTCTANSSHTNCSQ